MSELRNVPGMPTFLKSAIEASQQLALRFGIEDVTTNYGFRKLLGMNARLIGIKMLSKSVFV